LGGEEVDKDTLIAKTLHFTTFAALFGSLTYGKDTNCAWSWVWIACVTTAGVVCLIAVLIAVAGVYLPIGRKIVYGYRGNSIGEITKQLQQFEKRMSTVDSRRGSTAATLSVRPASTSLYGRPPSTSLYAPSPSLS